MPAVARAGRRWSSSCRLPVADRPSICCSAATTTGSIGRRSPQRAPSRSTGRARRSPRKPCPRCPQTASRASTDSRTRRMVAPPGGRNRSSSGSKRRPVRLAHPAGHRRPTRLIAASDRAPARTAATEASNIDVSEWRTPSGTGGYRNRRQEFAHARAPSRRQLAPGRRQLYRPPALMLRAVSTPDTGPQMAARITHRSNT